MATQFDTDGRSAASTGTSTSTLITLLAVAIFINALDRGNFSTAAPLIKDQLELTNSQIGVLISEIGKAHV